MLERLIDALVPGRARRRANVARLRDLLDAIYVDNRRKAVVTALNEARHIANNL